MHQALYTAASVLLAGAVACSVAAGGLAPHIAVHGCVSANVSSLPFCDPSLSISARARDLRSRLTRAERLCLMDSAACAVPRLGLPAYNWGVEDLHGAGIECLVDGAQTHCPTIFPTLNILASSMNDTLAQAVGHVIGTEMRAANNAGATRGRRVLPRPGEKNLNPPIGVNGWGPNINMCASIRRCFVATWAVIFSPRRCALAALCSALLLMDTVRETHAGVGTKRCRQRTASSLARSGPP